MIQRESKYAVRIPTSQSALWKTRRPLLTHLDIELTERCNNNCIHCYINLPADDFRAKERELTTEEIKGILKEAASLGCLRVRFTGGEPLLRQDFKELYLFARGLGLKVLIFTNATLITPELVGLFERTPPLKEIEVSLYGMKRKSYEAVTRVSGSFEAAWRGINLLLESKIPFVAKGALLPPNKEEIGEFEAWASTIQWMDKPPSYSVFFDLRCRRDSQGKNSIIMQLRPSPEEGLEIFKRRENEYLSGMREFCSRFIGPPGENLFSCGAGTGGGCIDAYGYLQPCMMLRHPATVHNLKNGSLENGMKDFSRRIRKMKAKNAAYLVRCSQCFLKGLCEQCPGKSWIEHGTLDTPVEYLCELAHAQAKYLGLLEDFEKGWKVTDWKERIRKLSDRAI